MCAHISAAWAWQQAVQLVGHAADDRMCVLWMYSSCGVAAPPLQPEIFLAAGQAQRLLCSAAFEACASCI